MNIRVDSDLKSRASEALAEMGITMSEAVRYTLEYIAENHRLPAAPFYVGADDNDEDIVEIARQRLANPGRRIRVKLEDL